MREEDIPLSPAPQRSEITIEVCSPKRTNHVTDITAESYSMSDSVPTEDPIELLNSAMEIEEVDIGMCHPYLANINPRSDNTMLKCKSCSYVTFNTDELKIYDQRFQSTPDNNRCTPTDWGSHSRESHGTRVTNKLLSPSVNKG